MLTKYIIETPPVMIPQSKELKFYFILTASFLLHDLFADLVKNFFQKITSNQPIKCFIPIVVLDELDQSKKGSNETGAKSRNSIRLINLLKSSVFEIQDRNEDLQWRKEFDPRNPFLPANINVNDRFSSVIYSSSVIRAKNNHFVGVIVNNNTHIDTLDRMNIPHSSVDHFVKFVTNNSLSLFTCSTQNLIEILVKFFTNKKE